MPLAPETIDRRSERESRWIIGEGDSGIGGGKGEGAEKKNSDRREEKRRRTIPEVREGGREGSGSLKRGRGRARLPLLPLLSRHLP